MNGGTVRGSCRRERLDAQGDPELPVDLLRLDLGAGEDPLLDEPVEVPRDVRVLWSSTALVTPFTETSSTPSARSRRSDSTRITSTAGQPANVGVIFTRTASPSTCTSAIRPISTIETTGISGSFTS